MPNYKCFTFNIPYIREKHVEKVELTMNAAPFGDEVIAPMDLDYYVALSYPNQVIRSLSRNKVGIRPQIPPTSCYQQITTVGSMEVLRRRDKSGKRCNRDWRNHDKHVLNTIAKKIGCTPTHWKIVSDMVNCTTNEQHRAFYHELYKIKESEPPCRGIEKLMESTNEIDHGIRCTFTGRWRLMLTFDFGKEISYKEVLLVRAYSFQSLIGNSGK